MADVVEIDVGLVIKGEAFLGDSADQATAHFSEQSSSGLGAL